MKEFAGLVIPVPLPDSSRDPAESLQMVLGTDTAQRVLSTLICPRLPSAAVKQSHSSGGRVRSAGCGNNAVIDLLLWLYSVITLGATINRLCTKSAL